VLYDKKDNTCLLTDIAIPDDSNFNTKETEKLRKYKGQRPGDQGQESFFTHCLMSSDWT